MKREIQIRIGKRIRNARRHVDITIEGLAEALYISPSYLGLLERGERSPSLAMLKRICAFFHCTPNDILGYGEYGDDRSNVALTDSIANHPTADSSTVEYTTTDSLSINNIVADSPIANTANTVDAPNAANKQEKLIAMIRLLDMAELDLLIVVVKALRKQRNVDRNKQA